MSFWSSASNNSQWRGLDYFEQGKVTSFKQVADSVYESYIGGTAASPYQTVIDVSHPRKSHCDCPFAEGRRVICKHMVALFFTIFPSEVDVFLHEVKEYNKEVERQEQEHYKKLEQYVKSLKKEDLQRELYNALVESEERNNRYW
jgi:uncharacterized Zn finger protein